MTFYQELQLSPAGSKEYIAGFENRKDKIKHTLIYLLKIILNIAFSMAFITLFSILFGTENSVAGLAVLLFVMAFRFSDFGIHVSHSIVSIFMIFGILAIGPKISNIVPVGWAFCVNVICIMLLMIIGCHKVEMFNHSTLILSYLLLQAYDVSGQAYKMRLICLFTGALLTALVFYRNHRKITYEKSFKDLFKEFNLSSDSARWKIRFTIGISSAMLLAALIGIPKAAWIGISAMSVCLPKQSDVAYRAKFRVLGNVVGAVIFLVLYLVLPEGSCSYMGIIGGIGVGLSACYGWQTIFNAVSTIAIAVPVFGLPYAILLRICNNIIGSVYVWLFTLICEPILSSVNSLKNRFPRNTASD